LRVSDLNGGKKGVVLAKAQRPRNADAIQIKGGGRFKNHEHSNTEVTKKYSESGSKTRQAQNAKALVHLMRKGRGGGPLFFNDGGNGEKKAESKAQNQKPLLVDERYDLKRNLNPREMGKKLRDWGEKSTSILIKTRTHSNAYLHRPVGVKAVDRRNRDFN